LNFGLPSVSFKHFLTKFFGTFAAVFSFNLSPYYFLDNVPVTKSYQFHFIQFLQHFFQNLYAFRALFLHLYIAQKKSNVTKRKTKYLSCHERTRIRLLRQSRDSTLVRPSSFESTYISSPMGFIVQCFLKESLSSIRSTFPLLSDFCFSFLTSFLLSDFCFSAQRSVPEYLALMEGT